MCQICLLSLTSSDFSRELALETDAEASTLARGQRDPPGSFHRKPQGSLSVDTALQFAACLGGPCSFCLPAYLSSFLSFFLSRREQEAGRKPMTENLCISPNFRDQNLGPKNCFLKPSGSAGSSVDSLMLTNVYPKCHILSKINSKSSFTTSTPTKTAQNFDQINLTEV